MKKTLEIELEEECLECPELSLETSKLSIGSSVYNLHRCEHLEFCQNVRKAWEAVQARKLVYCKEGKWIEDAETFYKAVNEKGGGVDADTPYFTEDYIACSECLALFSVIDNCTESFNYCPNCGARMEESDGNSD